MGNVSNDVLLMSPTRSHWVDPHLSCGVSGVPQGVPQMLAGSSGGVDHFNWQARVALSSCGCVGPVGLCDLFPHHCVEAWAGLVAKHETSVVVISVRVDEERSAEIHRAELIGTWIKKRDGLKAARDHVTPMQRDVCLRITYQQQCQDRRWQSAPTPCPDAGPPSWGQSGRCPWGPGEPFGICGSLFHWCQSSPGTRHRCPEYCLGQNRLCTRHHGHCLRGKHGIWKLKRWKRSNKTKAN